MSHERRGRVRNAAALLLPLLLVSCTEKQRTINARGEFTITRATGTAHLELDGRLYDNAINRAGLDQAWSVITRGTSPYDALAITLTTVGTGDGDPVPLLAGLVLAVPTPLRSGARYPIGYAFPPPAEPMPMYWSRWGGYDLRLEGTAEIALRSFDYHTVGMRVENEFIATGASGLIEVVDRDDDRVTLRLSLNATDATSGLVILEGELDLWTESYRPPT